MTRKDFRTHKQFTKDIKEAALIERAILKRWCRVLGIDPDKVTETGCGPNGEYLSHSEVHTLADYFVPDIGYVEVKYSKPLLDGWFHLKVQQVESYLKQKASILMVDGFNSSKAVYTFIIPDQLATFGEKYEVVMFQGLGFKPAYRLSVGDFIWRKL